MQGLQHSSSSPKAFTIKAVRWSKDVEVPNDIEDWQTAAPQRIKIGAKAKGLAARFVPAVLGELKHPESYHVHPMITPPTQGCCQPGDLGFTLNPVI